MTEDNTTCRRVTFPGWPAVYLSCGLAPPSLAVENGLVPEPSCPSVPACQVQNLSAPLDTGLVLITLNFFYKTGDVVD